MLKLQSFVLKAINVRLVLSRNSLFSNKAQVIAVKPVTPGVVVPPRHQAAASTVVRTPKSVLFGVIGRSAATAAPMQASSVAEATSQFDDSHLRWPIGDPVFFSNDPMAVLSNGSAGGKKGVFFEGIDPDTIEAELGLRPTR